MSDSPFIPPQIELQYRQIDFDCPLTFTQIWLANDPLESHFLNWFSVNTDIAEGYGMRAMRGILPQLKNAQLLANAKCLIKQEGSHRRLHHKLNEALTTWGYARIPLMIKKQYDEFFPLLEPGRDLKVALRAACLLENLSAYALRRFLIRLEKDYKNIDPMMAYLFGYHAAEELEHKSVCFDCYTEVYGCMPTEEPKHASEWRLFNEKLMENLTESLLYFMMIDQLKRGEKVERDKEKLRKQIFGTNGIFPRESDYESYGKLGFHPWHIDDLPFVQRWDNDWAPYFRQVLS
ncbi:metal-dependent hydrolase [Coxiella burnetii]|uniref:Metal-dependent hydrolase n=2 Tax=Coxiella burnetii TaxID=777 RepID=Q83EJ8_COXBU|nr:metal-dependent hydrolase [Coxiella burnetii]NP_819364.1 hypothetical protein CBU_0322 [Coxiella burnetii RSA 493]AAO89878.1 hypothetical protein CBU_0322 [Coxiella burnetii RSA 493]ABS76516.1 hypothetical protein CBUD_1757 [Coxiella burnetii Dugway 5J108-111]ABX77874.1 conserved hypothetical protein [Coxiella burnetii RSA 331]ACJ19801.1 hypothetical protein CbuK_0521 [Coxiella burnetii CbuK_Q154]AML49690.1 hypothetical protein AUR58_11365 [Coxiella burnetii]